METNGTDRLSNFGDFVRRSEENRETAEQQAHYRPSVELALMMVRIRKYLGISQRQFAERVGVSQAYIAKLESGAANPSLRKLNDLLRKAGVTLNVSATVRLSPQAEQEAFEVSGSNEQEHHLSEGEMMHLTTVIEGVIEAVGRSRIDERPLEEEAVVGEIIARYRARELSKPRHSRDSLRYSVQ